MILKSNTCSISSKQMKSETKSDKYLQPIEGNKHVHFSFTKGLEVNFFDENNTITYKMSLYTGNEKVLINNQIVSKKRTFRKHSKHIFQFNGNEYVIEFRWDSLVKYTWTCSLLRNGTLIKEYECENIQNEQPFYKRHPEVIYGGLTGFALALGFISLYTVLAILTIGTVLSVWYIRQFLLVRESQHVLN